VFSLPKSLAAAAVLGLIPLTTGCSTAPTPYQPYIAEGAPGVHGGYSDQQLAPDRFLVRFHGNEFTSRDQVEGYLLYRAAELTVQSGYDSFVMVNRHTEHDVQTYATPDPFYHPWYGMGYGYWRPDWSYYSYGRGWGYWHPGMGPFWYDTVDIHTIEAFEATAEVKLLKGPPPPGSPEVFDARAVMASLGPSIQLPGQPK
jgi:hypothetical protein